MNMSSMENTQLDYSPHKQAKMVNILSQANKSENKQHRQENLDNWVTLANNMFVDLSVYIVVMHSAMDLLESNLESCELI